MSIRKGQRLSFLRIVPIFAIVLLIASCGRAESVPMDIGMQYYNAIAEGDADTAASFFADGAVIMTPGGNVLSGIDEIKATFIPFDLQFMDHVEFLTDFTEINGKLYWTQEYHEIGGNFFASDCEVTIENGKIVEWIFN